MFANVKNHKQNIQINEYIARAHKMSSSNLILKCMTVVMFPHWSAQKKAA